MDTVRQCIRCKSDLPKDSGYCISCGCQNEDIFAKKATAEIQRREHLDKVKNRQERNTFFRGLFRFFGR